MKTIPYFTGCLVLQPLPNGKDWKLMETFGFMTEEGKHVVVPENYIVDGASIPRPFWRLIGSPMTGKYRRASVIHDYLCRENTTPRAWTDKVFLSAMKVGGVPSWKRRAMYWAVRAASFFS